MKLKAKVRNVTGRTQHSIGTVMEGELIKTGEFPLAATVEIEEDESGYFLFRYASDGSFAGDSWFVTLEETKRQAKFEFEIVEEDWITEDA